MFSKLLKKKENGPAMSPDKMEAKRKIIEELRSLASDMMHDDLGEGMKKVTVASPSKEGLAKGLDVAKEAVAHPDLGDFGKKEVEEGGMHGEEEPSEEEMPESAEEELSEVAAGHKMGQPNHEEEHQEKNAISKLSEEDARALTKKLRSALRE